MENSVCRCRWAKDSPTTLLSRFLCVIDEAGVIQKLVSSASWVIHRLWMNYNSVIP